MTFDTMPTNPPPYLNKLVKKPPPLWYVTNGETTVGPVSTNLLMLGVYHERIPDDCMVREKAWTSYCDLGRIREVAALRRAQACNEAVHVEPARWVDPARKPAPFPEFAEFLEEAGDRNAVFERALAEAMKVSGALVGAVHRRMPPYRGFVTTVAQGPGMKWREDHAFAADEPTFLFAAEGRALCEPSWASASAEKVSERLGMLASCAGVAMIPVHVAGHLYAVLELGRPDHNFRQTDFKQVATITQLVSDRFETVMNRGSRMSR